MFLKALSSIQRMLGGSSKSYRFNNEIYSPVYVHPELTLMVMEFTSRERHTVFNAHQFKNEGCISLD